MGACAAPDHSVADWQLDLEAEQPASAEQVRVCVAGVGVVSFGAGNGRVAVPGLPPEPTEVRVEVYGADGAPLAASPWTALSDDAPLASVGVSAFEDPPCEATGDYAAEGEPARLFVSRFVQEGW